MSTGDFRVADISLADFGRKEIEIAEHEVIAPTSQFFVAIANLLSVGPTKYVLPFHP